MKRHLFIIVILFCFGFPLLKAGQASTLSGTAKAMEIKPRLIEAPPTRASDGQKSLNNALAMIGTAGIGVGVGFYILTLLTFPLPLVVLVPSVFVSATAFFFARAINFGKRALRKTKHYNSPEMKKERRKAHLGIGLSLAGLAALIIGFGPVTFRMIQYIFNI